MGRIVINETENKQTVILNDSPAGVEGGYFDSQMVWHEMGGGSDTPEIPEPFMNRRSLIKSDGLVYYSTYTAKRMCSAFPFKNPGKVRAKSNDYAINLIGIANMTDVSIFHHATNQYDLAFPQYDATEPAFVSETESDAPYVWIALSKNSGDFTAEECLHPLGTVFEIVEE